MRLPELEDGEVHVWSATLPESSPELASLEARLSPEERERAARIRSPAGRRRFVAARAKLRLILALYDGEPPERLRFREGPFGKPELERSERARRLEFSVAHSGGMAVYALSRSRTVGIDIEPVRPVPRDDERLSEIWLTADELATLRALADPDRTRAFYTLWTRKEAYLKARGLGFSEPPNRVWVRGEQVFVAIPGDSGRAQRTAWSVRDVSVGHGYATALAVEGSWSLARGFAVDGLEIASSPPE